MSKIPLYNCYWCACAYCVRRFEEDCFSRCIECYKSKKVKISDYCDRFLEDTKRNEKIYAEISKCNV